MFDIYNSKKTQVSTKDITQEEEERVKKELEDKKNDQNAPITRNELRNVLKAMDQEGFSNIMEDYIKEISDPNNVKEQNQFLEESEQRKDLPPNVVLAKPSKAFCFKSKKRQIAKPTVREKVFINICILNEVPEPEEKKDEVSQGSFWSLPYLVNKPRNDMDSKNRHCQTFDVIFHPKAVELAKKYPPFKKFVCDNAINGINTHYLLNNKEEASLDYCMVNKFDYKGTEISLINIHGLKSKKHDDKREATDNYKTQIMKDIEAKKEEEANQEGEFDQVDITESKIKNISATIKSEESKKNDQQNKRGTKEQNTLIPKYIIKYSDSFELHNFFYNPSKADNQEYKTKIIIDIFLSNVDDTFKLANNAELELKERKLQLKIENIYDCVIELKSNVAEETLSATWNKSNKVLTVTGLIKRSKVEYKEKEDDRCEIVRDEDENTKKDDNIDKYENANDDSKEVLDEKDELNKQQDMYANSNKASEDNNDINDNNNDDEKNDVVGDINKNSNQHPSSFSNNSKLDEVKAMLDKIKQEKLKNLVVKENESLEIVDNNIDKTNHINFKDNKALDNNEESTNMNVKPEIIDVTKCDNKENELNENKQLENTNIKDNDNENISEVNKKPEEVEEIDQDDVEVNELEEESGFDKINLITFNNPLIFEIV